MVRYLYILFISLFFPVSAFAAIDYYDWSQIGEDGFGDVNSFNAIPVEYNGYLYFRSQTFGDSVPLWRTNDGITWTELDPTFNEDGNNSNISDLKEYDDNFFAVISNNDTGVELWQTDDGEDWFQAGGDGIGNGNNTSGWIFKDDRDGFDERYYMVTTNIVNGGQIYYSDGGWTWHEAAFDTFNGIISYIIEDYKDKI